MQEAEVNETENYSIHIIEEQANSGGENRALFIKSQNFLDFKNSLMMSFNLINIIVGAGIIALSNSFTSSGLGLGILLLLFSSILASFTVSAIVKCGCITLNFTYQSIVNKTMGKPGYILISVCQILYPSFSIISYMILIRDNLVDIIDYFFPNRIYSNNFYTDRRFILGIVTLFIVFPISSLRNIEFLEKASAVSILSVIYYCLVIIIRTNWMTERIYYFPETMRFANKNFLVSIPLIAFALSCHHAVIPLFRSMRISRYDHFSMVSLNSMNFVTILYALVAISGYISTGGFSNGNLLTDYCINDTLILSARIVFSFTLILTIPLQVFAVRETIANIILKNLSQKLLFHVIIGFIIVAFCYMVSILVKNVEAVNGLSGSLMGGLIVYVLPAYCFLKLNKHNGGWRPNSWVKVFCYISIFYGLFVMILGTTYTIISINSNSLSNQVKYWCFDV